MITTDLRDRRGFERAVEPFRRELAAHCYRMVGSLADAEDLVQETMLAAWRGIDGFEGRASMRTWLYKIATNRCLDAIRSRPRRGMPYEHGTPGDPSAPLPPNDGELPWVDPCPAGLAEATPPTPEAAFSARESVQLAFVVALQHLPASQRAVLILRDVVGWSAEEVAELLDTSVASVNSALQRARETLDKKRDRFGPTRIDAELVARYAAVWEAGDMDALVALLHHDVVASMPPIAAWFRGRDALRTFITPRCGRPETQRVVRVAGADEVVLAIYRRREGATVYAPHAIQVVRFDDGQVRGIHAFLDDALFARFDAPLDFHR